MNHFAYDVMPGAAAAAIELENMSPARDPLWIPDWGGSRSDSGIDVNHMRALGHPAILQGVKILAGAFAQMKVDLIRRVSLPGGKQRIEEVKEHPGAIVARNRSRHREMTRGGVVTICQYRGATMNHAVMAGDGFGAIQRDGGGRPLQKVLLPPFPDTTVEYNDRGQLKVRTQIRNPDNQIEEFWLNPIDVFQIQNLSPDGLSGYPLTELAANAIGQGLAGYKYAGKSWANNASPKGLLSAPGALSPDQVRENTKQWMFAHRGLDNVGKIAHLSGGTTYERLGMSHIDAQLVEYLEADVKTQARLLNIPPFLLGMTDSSGLKMAELIAFFVQFTLGDWICNWTEQMRIKLLTEREWQRGDLFFKFDVSGFLTTNWPEHVKTIVEAVGGPVLQRTEGRAMLQVNPDVDDDQFLERATGAKPSMGTEEPPDEDRMAQIENRLQAIDLDKAKAMCQTESQKVTAALERDGFENWANDFYGTEWKSRLADRFTAEVAEKYCETRRTELIDLLTRSGRGAIEADAKNATARGYLLIDMELEKNGHRVTHTEKE